MEQVGKGGMLQHGDLREWDFVENILKNLFRMQLYILQNSLHTLFHDEPRFDFDFENNLGPIQYYSLWWARSAYCKLGTMEYGTQT